MSEMFASEMQLCLDLGPLFAPTAGKPVRREEKKEVDPLGLLKPETDPGWIEDILDDWNDLEALKEYCDRLYDDLRNTGCLSGTGQDDFTRTMARDLRDSIRVIGARIRELESLS